MDFRPSSINNQTHKCTIQQCMICPLKNTCSHYIEQLEKELIGIPTEKNQIEKSHQQENQTISQLLDIIENLQNQIFDINNELTAIRGESALVSNRKVSNSASTAEPIQIYIKESNASEAPSRASGDAQRVEDDLDDENQSQVLNNENGLSIYTHDKGKPVLIEKKTIFGNTVWKEQKQKK